MSACLKHYRGLLAAVLLSLLCVACHDDDDDSTASAEAGQAVGVVVNIGLKEDSQAQADDMAQKLGTMLGNNIPPLPGVTRASRTVCPVNTELDGETAACFDVRVLVPSLPTHNIIDLVTYLKNGHEMTRQFREENAGSMLSFMDFKGMAGNGQLAMLFAMRQMIASQDNGETETGTEESLAAKTVAYSTSSTTKVTVDPPLIWTNSTRAVTKGDGYEKRILAPGFNGTDGSSGIWVLYGLDINVKKGEVYCLRGRFRDLTTGSQTTVTAGNCTDIERSVTLSGSRLATAVSLKISDNNAIGLGLGYGEPTLEVDPFYPDFLLDVSSKSFQYDGKSDGTYAPETSRLTSTWPYVVIGVAASAKEDKVSALTVYLGRLTALEAGADDVWAASGYTVEELETAVDTGLNSIWDTLVDLPLTFDVFPGCTSTLDSLEFCNNMKAKASYSTSEMDSACKGVCNSYYDSCQFSKDACKVACCYGCVWGKTCSCNYSCGDERDACYKGCTQTFTGSAEVNVKNVTGLEKLIFSNSSLPYLGEGSVISVETTATVSKGLTARVYWELCQSGLCFSDTTPLTTSQVKIRAKGLLEARACESGKPAVYMSISDVEIIDNGAWNIDDFVDDIVGVVQSSMDWLADNISDLFYYNLSDEYEQAMDSTMDALESALNGVLVDTPVIPCE